MTYHEFGANQNGSFFKQLLWTGLEDDGFRWDWTTRGTVARRKSNRPLRAQIIAKSRGVWAAAGLTAVLPIIAQEIGGALQAKSRFKDGDEIKKGDVVCEWEGTAEALLALERPYLNLASYAGGIATQTDLLVRLVTEASRGKNTPRVTSTRKILPGYRDLAIAAVQAGGGKAHRVSLAGGVLIKENHIEAAGSIEAAIAGAREIAPHGLKIEIEVKNLDEVQSALAARTDGLLLDNFKPSQVKSAVALIAKSGASPVVEVSGGVTAENIASYVIPGVHVISVGGLTHSVRSLDLSLLVIA